MLQITKTLQSTASKNTIMHQYLSDTESTNTELSALVNAYPCRQRWQAEPGRRCKGCMTSAGSPCNYGDWVTGRLDAPEWPVGANNKANRSVFVRVSANPHTLGLMSTCVWSHPLDPLFVDTDAPEQRFKDFAECEGKESNGAELQTLSHLLEDGRRLLLDVIGRPARLFGNLDDSK